MIRFDCRGATWATRLGIGRRTLRAGKQLICWDGLATCKPLQIQNISYELDDFWLYCVDEDGQELTRAVSDASCQEQYWTLRFDLSADWYDNLQYVELQLLAPDGTQDGFLLLLYQGDGALAG